MMDFLFIKVGVALFICFFFCVLGLARTGLIFTRIQQGTQPGGLTQPGQTEPGIPYHVPSCWVPVGGAARQELTSGSGARGASQVLESGSVGSCDLFSVFPLSVALVLLFPLFCCSVKLPLSQPTSFCLFLCILLCTAWRFRCRRQPKPKH